LLGEKSLVKLTPGAEQEKEENKFFEDLILVEKKLEKIEKMGNSTGIVLKENVEICHSQRPL